MYYISYFDISSVINNS